MALKRLARVTLGKMLQSERRSPTDVQQPYLRAANVQPDGMLAPNDVKTMWFGADEAIALDLRGGDVVVVEGGVGGFGRAAFVPEDLTGWGFQNSINRLRPVGGVDGRYLAYVLIALRASGWIRAYCNIVSMPHLTAEKLADVRVPLVTTETQALVADYLDRETARIDDVIAEQSALTEVLEQRRVALVTHSMSDEMRTAPLSRLKRVSSTQTGLTLGGEATGGVEVPYLRVANVQADGVDVSTLKTATVTPAEVIRHSLQAGDVLMTEGGDLDKLGRGAVWDGSVDPCLHQNHVFAVRCDADLDRWFLTYWMGAQPARQYFRDHAKKTTNLAAINSTILGNLPLPLPPLQRQIEIVAHLDEQTGTIDRLVGECRELIMLLKERRSALITAAVTGQLDVRD